MWRSRGAFLSPAQLQGFLTHNVLVAGVATEGSDPGAPLVGLAELLDPDFVDRRAHLSLIVDPERHGSGLGVAVALTFAKFCFATYALDKLCIEVRADNWRLVPGLRRLTRHEGTLRHHLNIAGEWKDLEIFALFREDLEDIMSRLQRGCA